MVRVAFIKLLTTLLYYLFSDFVVLELRFVGKNEKNNCSLHGHYLWRKICLTKASKTDKMIVLDAVATKTDGGVLL